MEGSEQFLPTESSTESDYLQNLEVGKNQTSGNNPGSRRPLSGKEKIHAILIVIIGVLALGFGFWQFFFASQNPFKDIVAAGQKTRAEKLALQQAQVKDMMTRDTDTDGLSDQIEQSVYHTSPYLKDSDSDGVDDKTEITRGTDPSCAEGQRCTGLPVMDSVSSPSASGQLDLGTAENSVETTATTQSGYSALTPTTLRQMLKQSGMSDEDLNGATDTELMQVFALYLQDNPTMAQELQKYGLIDPSIFMAYTDSGNLTDLSGLVDSTSVTVTKVSSTEPTLANVNFEAFGVTTAADLKKLSGAQIRLILIQSGGDPEILNSISDQEIKNVFIGQLDKRLVSSTATST